MKIYVIFITLFCFCQVKSLAQEKPVRISLKGNLYIGKTYSWYSSQVPYKPYNFRNHSFYFRPAVIVHMKNSNFWEFEMPDFQTLKNSTEVGVYPSKESKNGIFEFDSSNIYKSGYFGIQTKSSYNINLLKKSKRAFFTIGIQSVFTFEKFTNNSYSDAAFSELKINRLTISPDLIQMGGYHFNDHLTLSYSIPYEPLKLYLERYSIQSSRFGSFPWQYDFDKDVNTLAFYKIIFSLSYRF